MTSVKRDDIELIRSSDLFDADWYIQQYPDVKALGMDPAEHYLWIGAKLGRKPGPKFEIRSIFGPNINPLLHFEMKRRKDIPIVSVEGRRSSNKRPIIIYESHNLKLQGAPNSLFEIAKGVAQRNKCTSKMMSASDGPLGVLCRQNGIPVITHGVSADVLNRSGHKFDTFIDRLSAIYKESNAALIHVNTLQNFHCVHAANRAGLPVIWNVRESEEPNTYYNNLSRSLRDFAYAAFAKANHIVFVAETTRKLWRKRLDGIVSHSKITNGIDVGRLMSFVYGTNRSAVREMLGVKPDDILVLNVGTVSARKGQADLAEAISVLDERIRGRVITAFVGMNTSAYSRTLRNKLESLRRKELRNIVIEESVEESDRRKVAELYLASDVFVLCSRIESYPRVILEAMAFGLPIISTPCFGVSEQLIEGSSGLFYPAGDIAALSTHLSQLCSDKQYRERIAKNVRVRLAALNSYDQMIDAYERVYDRLLGVTG